MCECIWLDECCTYLYPTHLCNNLSHSGKFVICKSQKYYDCCSASPRLSQRRSLNLLSTNTHPPPTQTFKTLPGKLQSKFSVCNTRRNVIKKGFPPPHFKIYTQTPPSRTSSQLRRILEISFIFIQISFKLISIPSTFVTCVKLSEHRRQNVGPSSNSALVFSLWKGSCWLVYTVLLLLATSETRRAVAHRVLGGDAQVRVVRSNLNRGGGGKTNSDQFSRHFRQF